ncbi:diacylglycerol O-acyltransferase 1, variant 2 [Entomophthora muscae]|uniref:Diacylglycerol O-acyltransferase 1, variant 2 n=1 Tax=Entomophthora muscae TaxID=34485 RepID=A0ACC2U088_9FUNG|nr:diacylglycerol O-acyltransferase 1, variant 2 [Entomophthora muscae]
MAEITKENDGFPLAVLQTLTHIIYPWSPFIGIGLFMFLSRYSALVPFLVAYAIYIKLDKAHEQGSRSSAWLRNIPFWDWYTGYFPAKLLKEAELSPDNNYIFGYHPHGIIALGGFANFASNGTGFSELFPGLQVHMLTLNLNFMVPFYRDFILFIGMASVSKESINYILNRGTGNACLISVGGSAESLLAGPDNADLVLSKRLGFIKVAIQNGAHLVPVYNFGENSLAYQYSPEEGTLLHIFQQVLKNYTGMTLPFFYARGWFPNTRGVVPFDVPMTTVGKNNYKKLLIIQLASLSQLLRIPAQPRKR